jgi:hypothetical protein
MSSHIASRVPKRNIGLKTCKQGIPEGNDKVVGGRAAGNFVTGLQRNLNYARFPAMANFPIEEIRPDG